MKTQSLPLTIELVPSPCWGRSLAKLYRGARWDKLRKQAYADAGHRRSICNTSGRLFCHEMWRYDDDAHVQSLAGLTAICEMCHHVKHIGRAGVLALEGSLDMEAVIQHFLRVNQCDRETFDAHEAQARTIWRERSKHEWTTEFDAYLTGSADTGIALPQQPSLW